MQTLVGDLGFNSIMITDLVGGVSRAFPGLVVEPHWFSPSRTLGDVIAHVTSHHAPVSPTARTVGPQEPEALRTAVAPEFRIAGFPEVQALAARLNTAEGLATRTSSSTTAPRATRRSSGARRSTTSPARTTSACPGTQPSCRRCRTRSPATALPARPVGCCPRRSRYTANSKPNWPARSAPRTDRPRERTRHQRHGHPAAWSSTTAST